MEAIKIFCQRKLSKPDFERPAHNQHWNNHRPPGPHLRWCFFLGRVDKRTCFMCEPGTCARVNGGRRLQQRLRRHERISIASEPFGRQDQDTYRKLRVATANSEVAVKLAKKLKSLTPCRTRDKTDRNQVLVVWEGLGKPPQPHSKR